MGLIAGCFHLHLRLRRASGSNRRPVHSPWPLWPSRLAEGAVFFGRVGDNTLGGDNDPAERPALSMAQAQRKFAEFIRNFQSDGQGHESMEVYKYR